MASTNGRAGHDALIERRTLELLIRAAEAQERLYERRLERTAEQQRRTREAIESQVRRQHYGRLPGGPPTTG